ncbi:MAG TPA: mechanosensitive ion channel [Deltaproteobacteria bacterium]|nr:mechanosensitive ion channel [Deltaproteobacteria bacterium]
MEQIAGTIQAWAALYGFRVIGAVAILAIGYYAAKAIRSLIRRILEKNHVDEMLISFTASVTYVAILAFVIIAALGKLGIQTASFIAVVGAAGLAIGLALQGSLANFAAGVLMVIFKPFRVGDYIEAAGTAGTVEDIGIFTTGLKSPDNKRIIVPNAKLTSDNITNYSTKSQRRVDLVASVSYGDDLDKVKKTLEEILSADNRVLSDPAFTVAVLSLSDSSVDFAVRPWVQSGDYWGVFFDLQEQIKKRFDAEGISIPFPQQDIYLHKAD